MEVSSSIFVNREEELQRVSEAVVTLQDRQRLLRTPIIEFSGVGVIGKTALLRQIKAICDDHGVFCVMKDAQYITSNDFNDIELLASDAPVAIILDALEEIDNEQVQTIGTRLGTLIDKTRSFVVLASRKLQTFENTRSIAKKLILHTLEPLPPVSCRQYLDNFALPLAARDIILEWTRGYPLAMKVMTEEVVNERLDPTDEQKRRQLLGVVIREVIEKKLLANVSSSDKARIQKTLELLSLPRRFNLILMQDLIEKFVPEPEYKEENSLAYIRLPKFLNESTNVLSWSIERAGYCIDVPIRNLLMLRYKIERPQQYIQIHKFLAEKYEKYARDVREVAGADYVRYLREALYHLACYEEPTKLHESLNEEIKHLAQVRIREEKTILQSLESFMQFYEEFQQDRELKEVLDVRNTNFVLSLIYKNFMEVYRRLPENEREEWLKTFFKLIVQKQEKDDFALIFEEGMHQITKQVPREEAIQLYEELIQGRDLKTLLGTKFNEVRALLDAELLSEG